MYQPDNDSAPRTPYAINGQADNPLEVFPNSSLGWLLIKDAGADSITLEKTMLLLAPKLGTLILEPKESSDIIHYIRPEESDASEQSSHSYTTELRMHTENPGEENEPDYLILGCVNNDERAVTFLAEVDKIVELLSPEKQRLLEEPGFRALEAQRFAKDAGRTMRMIVARSIKVLAADSQGRLRLSVDFEEMEDHTPSQKHRHALLALEDACIQVRTGIILEAGDILIINNHRVLHGRSAFNSDPRSKDRRQLLRIFIQSSSSI